MCWNQWKTALASLANSGIHCQRWSEGLARGPVASELQSQVIQVSIRPAWRTFRPAGSELPLLNWTHWWKNQACRFMGVVQYVLGGYLGPLPSQVFGKCRFTRNPDKKSETRSTSTWWSHLICCNVVANMAKHCGSVEVLVGGLEHFSFFIIFPYIGNYHPNWLSYFSEG